MTNHEIWKVQYENLLRLWSDETNRFWTRFQVFLAVNGGLLAVFPIILNLYSGTLQELTDFSKWMLIGISIAGIIESSLWFLITMSGKEVQRFYRKQVKKLEGQIKDLDFFIVVPDDERKKPRIYSITVLSVFLTLVFIAVWLFILILGVSTDFGTNIIVENIDTRFSKDKINIADSSTIHQGSQRIWILCICKRQ